MYIWQKERGAPLSVAVKDHARETYIKTHMAYFLPEHYHIDPKFTLLGCGLGG